MHENAAAVEADDLLAPRDATRPPEPVITATVESTDEVLEPPTPSIAVYDPFVRWLLSSTLGELSSIDSAPPFAAFASDPSGGDGSDSETDSDLSATRSKQPAPRPPFVSHCDATFARAAVEGELEAVADLLSIARREFGSIDEKLEDIEDEREESRERIALLEARIVKHLQDRDLAIAEKYTTEKQIEEAEAFKAQHPQRQGSLLGFLRRTSSNAGALSGSGIGGSSEFSARDVERLQKEVADTKVAAAHASSDLDAHYYRLRQLEKKCAGVKFEIAEASALEDDLRASLEQLGRERALALEKLRQVSVFSAEVSRLRLR
ncbi:hypothetical protein PybrP1_007256 [[Pythium] brassicae (nom. inval.)]|nr:hypothetical protein PybrP1_007256 [[Pythium] brassicae (nom. inval.)]